MLKLRLEGILKEGPGAALRNGRKTNLIGLGRHKAANSGPSFVPGRTKIWVTRP